MKSHPTTSILTRGFASAPHPSESFVTGNNNAYVEEMYRSWKQNPERYIFYLERY